MAAKTRARAISRPTELVRPKPLVRPDVMPEREAPLPDFTRLFLPIQNYLANAPHVNEEQLRAAIEAYNLIVTVMYGAQESKGPCSYDKVIVINPR